MCIQYHDLSYKRFNNSNLSFTILYSQYSKKYHKSSIPLPIILRVTYSNYIHVGKYVSELKL